MYRQLDLLLTLCVIL